MCVPSWSCVCPLVTRFPLFVHVPHGVLTAHTSGSCVDGGQVVLGLSHPTWQSWEEQLGRAWSSESCPLSEGWSRCQMSPGLLKRSEGGLMLPERCRLHKQKESYNHVRHSAPCWSRRDSRPLAWPGRKEPGLWNKTEQFVSQFCHLLFCWLCCDLDQVT